jgi:hypothetical protein
MLDGVGWSTPRPGRFTPEKYPVPIVEDVGWDSGPVWTVAENLAPNGIRFPYRPACSESLYRGVDHPSPSNAEVKERVELYLFSPLWDLVACYMVNVP